MKTKLPIILIFAAVLGVIGLIAAVRIAQRPDISSERVVDPVLVKAVPVESRTIPMAESFHGFIEADLRVDMAFQIAGRVESFGVADDDMLVEGDAVKQGQVIARLEPDRYDVAVKQAKARQNEAKAAISAATAEQMRARATRTDAQRELNRLQGLATKDVATIREVERAEIALEQAHATDMAARAQLESAQAAHEQADAAVLAAEVNLNDATLTSPIDGVVASVFAERGQMMQPGEAVMSLVRLNPVRLVVGIVESRIALVKVGQKVEVEVLALDTRARQLGSKPGEASMREGIVAVVPPAADPRSGVFRVEITLPNDDMLLRPGMVAKATITTGSRNVTLIPVEATYTEGDVVYVYTVVDGSTDQPKASRTPLEMVGIEGDSYLVAQQPDEIGSIIVQGQAQLRHGLRVRFGASPDADNAEAMISR